MEFANPKILWLLVAVPLLVAYYVWRSMQGGASILISTTDSLRTAPHTVRYYLRHLPAVLRIVALVLLIVALARPQSVEHETKTNTEGIDIVLAVDISGSMLARDFQPDRLTAAKEVASQFVANRQGDRIGLVVFAGEAFTQTPLTTDQSSLQTLLGRLRSGVVEDGTAIGNGLATALNRLRESDSKSKVVILLTDGVNNRGQIAPLTVADIAKEQNIKVYTIGVGRNGTAPYPVFDERGRELYTVDMKVEIDEKMLREIADKTGGEYFRATDKTSLERIYAQIDKMEKSKVEKVDITHVHEEYLLFVLVAIALLLMEFLVKYIILKRIP
ncbi:MAG: VWA domain-containing protein [Rikenellaceae bacterium]|nr:VWA domain-containing protein [Rikenellaceae bacterium]